MDGWHLSPWGIEGMRKTRRDDLFWLAETLLRSGGYATLFDEEDKKFVKPQSGDDTKALFRYNQEVLKLKNEGPSSDDVPQILIDF